MSTFFAHDVTSSSFSAPIAPIRAAAPLSKAFQQLALPDIRAAARLP